jgi:hypothetical protein
MKIKTILVLLTLSVSLYGQEAVTTSKEIPKICISQFCEDSLRVSIKDIIADPVLRIFDSPYGNKLKGFRLRLNINGVIYTYEIPDKNKLSQEQIQLLKTVRNDEPKYNQLFIGDVIYIDDENKPCIAKGLYLWLKN